MTARLEFFYDYVSVYSYLADSQLAALKGAEIIYRPMFLGAVMKATGNRPPASVEAKGRYLRQDVARWAQRYGIPLNMNPIFPQNTLMALRLALVAARLGVFDDIHRALFTAMWVEEKDLGSEEVIAGIAEDADIRIEQVESRDIKDELRANTDEAVQRGAFGAPTFFIGSQMIFGNDRFDFVKQAVGYRG